MNNSFIGIGQDLRENVAKKDFNFDQYGKNGTNLRNKKKLEFSNENDEQKFEAELINQMTMAELYIIYSHCMERLNSPFRIIKLYNGK